MWDAYVLELLKGGGANVSYQQFSHFVAPSPYLLTGPGLTKAKPAPHVGFCTFPYLRTHHKVDKDMEDSIHQYQTAKSS